MIEYEFPKDPIARAHNSYNQIREAIIGLYEILKIITSSPEDVYYKIGLDNILVLYQNVLQLMLNKVGTAQFINQLHTTEPDLNTLMLNFVKTLD